MKQEKVTATVSKAFGKTLREHGLELESLPIQFTYEELAEDNAADLEIAKSELEDNDIIGAVNAKRKAKARAKATTQVLKENGIKAPEKDDPMVIYRDLIRTFKNGKMPVEVARQTALNTCRAMFGADWTPEGDETVVTTNIA